ncbi:hypothetical protein SAY86_002980 [Trapa natans]|uniref:SAM domain-containing protein n=1 Tax=Trapa natans TaxID=22666 RepID=A0AAN7LV09_TRANT|nr:hypothetical protein SAY86_002980 [Trapa natans]
MDWSAWLSKTGLNPALVHEYGLEFTRNELQAEDLAYFDHEFLQSMGISVAKHRLEILKLARKDYGSSLSKLRFSSVLITSINKAKRSVGKYILRLVSSNTEEVAVKDSLQGPSREINRRVITNISNLTRKYSSTIRDNKIDDIEKVVVYKKHTRLALSGPLNQQDNAAAHHHNYKSPRLSGPLPYGLRSSISSGEPLVVDVKSHEKALLALQNLNYSKSMSPGSLDRSPARRSSSASVDGRPTTIRNMKSSSSGSISRNRSRPRVSAGPLGAATRTATGQRPSPRAHHHAVNRSNLVGTDQRVIDGLDEQSLWAKLFYDMKPT